MAIASAPARSNTLSGPGAGRRGLGAALILVAALLGWAALNRSGHSQTGWTTTQALAAGSVLSADTVTPTDIDVPETSDVWIGPDVPAGVVTQPLAAGALVTTHAIAGQQDAASTPAVTFAVPTQDLPLGLVAGDELDVWTVADGRATQHLDQVPVVAVSGEDGLEPSTSVAVGVAGEQERSAVVALAAERVVLVRHAVAPR